MEIKDYKTAYNQAFIIAQTRYKTEKEESVRICLEMMFPDLKYSKNENIVKAIIKHFKSEASYSSFSGYSKDDIINWLENQIKNIPTEDELEALRLAAYEPRKNWSEKLQDLYEKLMNINRKKTEESDNQNNYLYSNKTNDNKIEPKFKVEDFILNGDVTDEGKPEIFKVLKVCDTWYDVENVYDGRKTIITFKQEYSCRMWDIAKDAEDGDILVYGEYRRPFIFKGLLDKFHPNCPSAYCGIDECNSFEISSGDGWWTDEKVQPATKEEKDFLYQRISRNGYKWDDVNKELIEIEKTSQNSIWNEKDEYFFNSALQHISNSVSNGKSTNIKSDLTEWMKSLKNRLKELSNLDISDTEMDVLFKYADQNNYDGSVLNSLYKDLKKLRKTIYETT